MTELENSHLVRGVDHAAFPTFDPAGTVRFYRDVLGFPVVHSICAAGWGPEDHPDFIHFFFDIGNDDRIAFFYYFGLPEPDRSTGQGDVYARFGDDVPVYFVRSRHLAIHVDSRGAPAGVPSPPRRLASGRSRCRSSTRRSSRSTPTTPTATWSR